jgi:hypothetical protein
LLKQVTVEVASMLASLYNPSIDVLHSFIHSFRFIECCKDVAVWEQLPVVAVMQKLRNIRWSLSLIALQMLAVVYSSAAT